MDLTSNENQLLYLDGKILLHLELVLSVLSVTFICHEMHIWKERKPYIKFFGDDNVFACKNFILVTLQGSVMTNM